MNPYDLSKTYVSETTHFQSIIDWAGARDDTYEEVSFGIV